MRAWLAVAVYRVGRFLSTRSANLAMRIDINAYAKVILVDTGRQLDQVAEGFVALGEARRLVEAHERRRPGGDVE